MLACWPFKKLMLACYFPLKMKSKTECLDVQTTFADKKSYHFCLSQTNI